MSKLLLIEDDQSISNSLKDYLEREGFKVASVDSLSLARDISLSDIDLIIQDWMLPDGQGIDFIKELKKKDIQLPVIMLTARAEITDKVLGLEMGADDYLTKPFDPRELVARIRVQLRKEISSKEMKQDEDYKLFLEDLSMDLETREVIYKKKQVRLNKMEFDLLKFFLRSPNTVFSRQELLDQVWGMDSFPTTRTVDQHILSLRNKLSSDLIETIRGVGYRLK